jgi:hypothetical protein
MTGEDFPNRTHKVARQPAFADVTGRSGGKASGNVFRLLVNREKQNLCSRANATEMRGNLNSIQNRHGDIYNKDVRIQAKHGMDRLFAALSRSEDLEFVAKLGPKVGKHRFVVVGKQNTNSGHKLTPWGAGAAFSCRLS